MKMLDVV